MAWILTDDYWRLDCERMAGTKTGESKLRPFEMVCAY